MRATYRTHLLSDHCHQDWKSACIVKPPHCAIFFIHLLCFPFTFRYFYQHHVLEHPVSLNLTFNIYMTKDKQTE